MAGNPNKRRGDRAEMAVRDYLAAALPGTWRTRAGWDDDRGDVVVPLGDGHTCGVQVKDVGTPRWGEWWAQVAAQRRAGAHRVMCIWHKRRGHADPAAWHVVLTGEQWRDILVELAALRSQVARGGLRAPDGTPITVEHAAASGSTTAGLTVRSDATG